LSSFGPRLNTGEKSGFSGALFAQANPNTVYRSIFDNNMDDSSFKNFGDSLIKTITLPRQAFGGPQELVAANYETACKVSIESFFILVL
jgi:hypothetical protein